MSKFRVEIDVSFANESDAISLLNMVENFKDKVSADDGTIGRGDIIVERKCRYHECYHDEVPVKPCGKYQTVDFDNVTKKTWEVKK